MSDYKIPKPKLRDLVTQKTKRILPTALILALSAGMTFKMTYGRSKKEVYRKWYAETDQEERFKRIAKRGVFDSVPAK